MYDGENSATEYEISPTISAIVGSARMIASTSRRWSSVRGMRVGWGEAGWIGGGGIVSVTTGFLVNNPVGVGVGAGTLLPQEKETASPAKTGV